MLEHEDSLPITAMCESLDVSRSGYHSWKDRKNKPPTKAKQKQIERRGKIVEAFKESRNVYGCRKLHARLVREGIECTLNTVHADCKAMGVKSRTQKKFRVTTTDSNHGLPVAENILDRDFEAEKPGEKWATDITYIATAEGFLYLAVIIDLFSRRIVGWSAADHMKTELVVAALKMAVGNSRHVPDRLLLHSDRGVQFASDRFRECLTLAGITRSMSSKGDCWDNAPCESWFGKLKTEWIYGHKTFATRLEAERAVFEYIEVFYNRERIHQSLDYLTPMEFEKFYYLSNN